jgi:spore protease
MSLIRTDLAVEAWEIAQNAGNIDGVVSEEKSIGSVKVTKVKVLDEVGEKAIGKPIGTYVTVEIPTLGEAEDENFFNGIDAVAHELEELLKTIGEGEVLVAGLGNASMTPDALGPQCIKSVLVTRHIASELSKISGFEKMRSVAAVAPGVLGQTGVEAGEMLKALVQKINPAAVIVVDALASRRTARLGNTVQLADSGIIPGSGVGNARFAVNKETLGVPVISVGVPTVVDAATLAVDLLESAGIATSENEKDKIKASAGPNEIPLFVTPRYIDTIVEHAARLTGFAINRALNPSVSFKDMTALLS